MKVTFQSKSNGEGISGILGMLGIKEIVGFKKKLPATSLKGNLVISGILGNFIG